MKLAVICNPAKVPDDEALRVEVKRRWPEAALLWQLIANQFYYSASSNLRYHDPNMMTSLGRVFLRNLAMPFDAHLVPAGEKAEKPMFSRTL